MFEAAIEKRVEVLRKVRSEMASAFEEVSERIVGVLEAGGKIYFFGNGGSAADAQHIATELIDKLSRTRGTIPALALTTNTSLITAVANDKDFVHIFARQVEAYAREGDLLFGITTSGRSPNVLEAFRQGRRMGTVHVALTGADGLAEPDLADYVLAVPSRDTQLIQEVHIGLGHLLCFVVEERLFPE